MSQIEPVDAGWKWDDDFPLSQAVKVGNMLYLSGQVSVDKAGNVVGEDDLVKQTHQCFKNMKEILQSAGADFSDVIKLITFFTVDISRPELTKAYWDVRREYFGTHRPASTGLQVQSLIYPTLLLEIEAIAILPQ